MTPEFSVKISNFQSVAFQVTLGSLSVFRRSYVILNVTGRLLTIGPLYLLVVHSKALLRHCLLNYVHEIRYCSD